ncbi:hypothetical protein N9X24_01550 [Rickettsiales bacterium]|nr:hypothetical protein [Rickettsiales bacterium]
MSDVKRVTIEFPEEIYRIMKSFTAFNDSSVKNFVIKAVNKELIENNIKIPNATTLQTFEDTDNNKNTEQYNNFSEFLSQINKD